MLESFGHLLPQLHARAVGVRVALVGRSGSLALGSWRSGPAWSTVKIPLSLAALGRAGDTATRGAIRDETRSAITTSDNTAAAALWTSLGGGAQAADAVDRSLAAEGDRRTRTQSRQVRPPFSPFGQTEWSLDDQLVFTSGLACDGSPEAMLVKRDMASVVPSQRWGLGRLARTMVKGGWGPDPLGRYLVRQIGIVALGSRLVAVSVAAVPEDGSFAQGTATLDAIATWLRAALPSLPSERTSC